MKIEVLFPEICNLYGDLANVRYLKESVPNAELVMTSLKSVPAFSNPENKIDLIYMGTTTEAGIELSVKALTPYVDVLKKLIDDGQFILLTGNALDIFGKYISVVDGIKGESSRIEGLGILKTHSEYHMMNRHNSFYIGGFNSDGKEGIKVVGFKSIFGHTYAEETDEDLTNTSYAQQGWFNTIKGYGRNEDTKEEGFKVNNLYATYLTGPILPLNPMLTDWLIEALGGEGKAAYFEAAMAAYEARLKDFSNEHFKAAY